MPRAATRLAAAQLCLLAASAPSLDPDPPAGDALEIGGVTLRLLRHTSRLTEDGGFASFPYHLNGSIVTEADGRSWLYTSSQASGKWTTDVRSASLDPFTAAPNLGPTRRALNGTAADRWATMHLVLRVDDGLWVAFYSTGAIVRSAVASSPTGPFLPDATFAVRPSEGWEEGCSLEADGGFVLESVASGVVTGWIAYDTLCTGTSGLNGGPLLPPSPRPLFPPAFLPRAQARLRRRSESASSC